MQTISYFIMIRLKRNHQTYLHNKFLITVHCKLRILNIMRQQINYTQIRSEEGYVYNHPFDGQQTQPSKISIVWSSVGQHDH